AVEALGLVGVGGGCAEEQDVARRPALGHREPPGQVVDHDLRGERAPQRGDQQRAQAGGQAGRTGTHLYLILVPGGTSWSKVRSTALPSWDAASTMPLDSTPMSLAGLRLATKATLRPTSD